MNIRERKLRSQQYNALGVNVLSTEDKSSDLNFALRIFKQDVKDSNILKEYKSREEYIKPSIKRKRILEKAKYKQKFNNL